MIKRRIQRKYKIFRVQAVEVKKLRRNLLETRCLLEKLDSKLKIIGNSWIVRAINSS